MPHNPLSIITLIQGDITRQVVDAIVNAANAHLAGGGGVDGAIHRAGGSEIMTELRAKYTGCPTGGAVITRAGNLSAKFVIHAVGPRYRDGQHGEAALLASAYHESLVLARDHQCETIAFPSISTGIYGYPTHLAAPIALQTVKSFIQQYPVFKEIRFVLFDEQTFRVYEEVTVL